MLYTARVTQQLEANAQQLREFVKDEQQAFRLFDQALSILDRFERDEIEARLPADTSPGALPSEEWQDTKGLIVPFGVSFGNHREAREWAFSRISGIPTVAVDGSEIKPTKDYSLPMAAIQVAWFENPHTPEQQYIKDVVFQVIPPEELMREQGDGFGIADQRVALRRFEAETTTLIERMNRLGQQDWGQRPPVAFFDGSLVVSFAAVMMENLGRDYVRAICNLLEESERTGIPVVGYVDTSVAKDLATLLACLGNLPRPQRVPDSRLLGARTAWGDRTRSLVCAREGVLDQYVTPDGRNWSREICFTYLKTNQLAPPARLDFPRWILRKGLLDHVVDAVRSEVIVGNGYPYCIEAADACAVLGAMDREHFYRILQDFAARKNIELRIVPKAASKRRRRA